MTVVAFKEGVMACDSQVSTANGMWTTINKIRKVDGWLVGGAGDVDLLSWFLRSFDPEAVTKRLAISTDTRGDGLAGLVVSPKGTIYYVEERGIYVKFPAKFLAIGVGETAAMVAMECGASAEEAVRLTIKYDKGCGGKVHTLKL